MKIATQRTEDMKKLAKMIDSVGAGMLTTMGDDDALASRPMMPLSIDEHGSIWFFTKADATDKSAAPGNLNLSFADTSNSTFISLTGASELLRDRKRIDELWSPLMKTWFPQGKDDPSLALLCVAVDRAEYWDASSSSMVRMAAMAASAIAGKPVGMGENKTIVNR